ncbi:MAG: hypothetical protein KUL82_09040 [Bdellovibrio sp.]|nr:hypothetical protein [Bdellovibrio sp.]
MDIFEVSLRIDSLLSKSLTPDSVSVLKANGSIGTIKIVSSQFEGLSLVERLTTTLQLINQSEPNLLNNFDIAFVLVSKSEDSTWVDYKKMNEETQTSTNKRVARDAAN